MLFPNGATGRNTSAWAATGDFSPGATVKVYNLLGFTTA